MNILLIINSTFLKHMGLFQMLYFAFKVLLHFKLLSISVVPFNDNSLSCFLNWSQAFPLGPIFPASFSDSGCLFSYILIASGSGGLEQGFSYSLLLLPYITPTSEFKNQNKTTITKFLPFMVKSIYYNSTPKWSYMYITTKFFGHICIPPLILFNFILEIIIVLLTSFILNRELIKAHICIVYEIYLIC